MAGKNIVRGSMATIRRSGSSMNVDVLIARGLERALSADVFSAVYLEEMDKIETCQIYAEYEMHKGSRRYAEYKAYITDLQLSEREKVELLKRSVLVFDYVDLCVEDAIEEAMNIREEDREAYIETTVKKRVQSICDSGKTIYGGTWEVIAQYVRAQLSDPEYLNKIIHSNWQIIVDDIASRHAEGIWDYDFGRMKEVFDENMRTFFRRTSSRDTYQEQYGTDLELLAKSIQDYCVEGQEESLKTVTEIDLRGIGEDTYWTDLKIDSTAYAIDFSSKAFLGMKEGLKRILQADEDLVDYITRKLLGDTPEPFITKEAIQISDLSIGAQITISSYEFPYDLEQYQENIEREVKVMLGVLLGAFYGNIEKISDFLALVEKMSIHIKPIIYQQWSKQKVSTLDRVIQKIQEQSGSSEAKLAPLVKALNSHDDVPFESKALVLQKYIEDNKLESTVVAQYFELTGGGLGIGAAVKAGVVAYCEQVLKGDGFKETMMNVTKATPFTSMVLGVVRGLKINIEKAETGEPFFEEDANADFLESWGTLEGGLHEAIDAFTGLGIVVAIKGLQKLIPDAKNAWGFWKAAKEHRKEKRLEKQRLMESEEGQGKRIVDVEMQIIALTVAVNKQLKKMIACFTEILKRLIGIVAAIFKLLGVTYLVGVTLSMIKTVLHSIQNLYYIGRAIYKRVKGTKGVARRAAAAEFVASALNNEEYAIDLIRVSKIINKECIEQVTLQEGVEIPTTYEEINQFIKDVCFNQDAAYRVRLEKELTSRLFQYLSSKAAPALANLLFPATGTVTTSLGMAS